MREKKRMGFFPSPMLTVIFFLGIFSIMYYLSITIFLGIISFGIFWIVFGITLVGISVLGTLSYYNIITFKINRKIKKAFYILISLGIISFVIIESSIIYFGWNKKLVKSDYLVVLGAGLHKDKLSLALSQRLYKALEYLEKYPDTVVIVSGGQGPGESMTEAEAMKRFLIKHGIPENQIIKEDKSKSTAENFIFTKKIVKDIDRRDNIKISVVTNNFHMFRSIFLSKRAGFISYSVPCGLHPGLVPNYYIREYFAVINSFLFDKVH